MFQSWSALSFGASKIGGKVAEVGWKFTEVASQKVSEVSGAVSEKVSRAKWGPILYTKIYATLFKPFEWPKNFELPNRILQASVA